MDIYDILAIVLVVVFGAGFFGGYICARLDYFYVWLRARHPVAPPSFETPQPTAGRPAGAPRQPSPNSRPAAEERPANRVEIDTRTVVTKIDTAGIQKGSALDIGKTTEQQDSIDDAVSRLSNLKGK